MRNRVFLIVLLFAVMLSAMLSACASDSKNKTSLPNREESTNSDDAADSANHEESNNSNFAADQENAEGNLSLYLPVDGLEKIDVATPENGNGELPIFRWEAVEGASWYMVFVHRQDGKAYWSWEGSENEVVLGNIQNQNKINADGPRLLEPMTWAVVALDEEDKFIASSILQPISP